MNRRWQAILLPLLLAVLAASWLRYRPLSSPDSGFVIELQFVSPTNGLAWLRFNTGDGWNFRDTRFFSVTEGVSAKTYRVPLPAGDFRLFRILPPDGAPEHRVASARILDAEGQPVVAAAGAGYDTRIQSVQFAFDHPVHLTAPWEKSWLESGFDFVLFTVVFALLGALLAGRSAGFHEKWRALAKRMGCWSHQHPVATLSLLSVLAVAVSCHPVIFFGKSFASSSNGASLLYETFPTLPGAPAEPIEPYNRVDVFALPLWHLPTSVVTRDAVFRDHELPLWSRYTMGGLPLLGQGMSMVGDPLYWLTVAADGEAWAWDVRFLLARFLFVFGIGLVVWTAVRHLPVAALLAISSAFIGLYTYRFNHPAIFSVCYSPWILWCWLKASENGTLRRAAPWALALIGANWMELNSGTAKEMCMLLIATNGIGGLAMWLRSEPWKLRLRKLALMAASVVAFLAISAPIWMVFLQTLQLGATIYDIPKTAQLSPGLFLGLFDEIFTRQLMLNEWVFDPSVNFFVLIGILWLLADARRTLADPTARATMIGALPCLAIVFGVVPPGWIDQLLFLKNIAHVDDTFISVLIVPLFVLAGFGLRSALDPLLVERRWRECWKISLVLLAILFALFYGTAQARPRLEEFAQQFNRATAYSSFFVLYATALLLTAALLPWLARRFLRRPGFRAVEALGIALCLVALHFRFGMWLETKFDSYVVNPKSRAKIHGDSPAVDFIKASAEAPARTIGFGTVMRAGFATALRLETSSGTDAIQLKSYVEWYAASIRELGELYYPTLSPANFPAAHRFYDAMNVRYFLVSPTNAPRSIPGLKTRLHADLDVLESETAWPRAFFTDRVTRYDRLPTLMRWIDDGDGRPFAAVSLEEASLPPLSPDQSSRHIVAARDYRLTSNTTAFTIDASSAGLVVLNEVYAAGQFRARLNGMPAPILRVNHTFKGVAVPGAGTYRLEFEYWPQILTTALWTSLAGLVAVAAAALYLIFSGKRPTAAFGWSAAAAARKVAP